MSQPTAPTTSSLAALQAVRTLAGGLRGGTGGGGNNKTVAFTPECLAAAEVLLNAKGPVGGDEHAARLVLQWAVAVLCGGGAGGNQKQHPKEDAAPSEAAKEERVWQVCGQALTSSPSVVATLPMASALGLLHAAAGSVFSPSMPPPTATAAVHVYAALVSRGLPQVPADRVVDLVAEVVERLHACQQQHQPEDFEGARNKLGALALQYLVTVQTQQTNQRKAFGVLVGRVVQPLLALHHHLQPAQQPKGVPVSANVVALRRAIDAVLTDLLFHREHLDGLRALLAPGGGTSGSSKKRQRAAKKPEADGGGGGEGDAAGSPVPAQDKWASYQGQLLQALDSWLNKDGEATTTKAVVMSLGHLYRLFVRRLSAVALLSVKDSLPHTPTHVPAAANARDSAAAATASAAAGQKRKEAEMAAASAASSSLVSRPAFAFAVKLWAMLWKGAGDQPTAGRTWRLTAARGVLEAVLQLNVYHYDSNQTAAGQYKAIESIFLELLAGCSGGGGGEKKQGTTTQRTETTVLDGEEVRCLDTLLRIDHRVAETCLARLLALLARRFVVVVNTHEGGGGGRKQSAQAQQQQHQLQASANNSLRQACARTMGEVVDTYARLRQNEVLLTAFLSLETTAADDAAATALVGQTDVGGAIGRVIRECPPPQLVPLWDLLAPVLDAEKGETGASLGRPGVRSRLFGLFVENLRVSSLNAAELGKRTVATLAHLETVVLAQLGGKKKSKGKNETTDAAAGIVGVALELYARLLEVQVTCEFWLDGSNLASSSSSSSSSSALLQALMGDPSALLGCKRMVDKLVIGRLRQLLQEKGVRGAEGEDAEKEDDHKEHKALVAFLFQEYEGQEEEEENVDLSLVGASLPLWAPHCRTEHLDLLWRAVLMDSFAHVSNSSPEDKQPQPPPSIRLLTDAAFYEIGPMAERAVPCLCRFLLDNLVPPKEKEGVVEELAGLVEERDPAALLAVVKQVLQQQEGKEKKKKEKATALVQWATGKQPTAAMQEDAVARAVHGCRLFNSFPAGYLSSEDVLLSFLFSVLLSHVVAAGKHPLLHLCVTTSALRALQHHPESIVSLLMATPELEEWLVQAILPPPAVSSSAARNVGLELLMSYHHHLVTQQDGKEEEEEEHVSRCLQAMVKQGLVATLQQKTKKEEEEEEEVVHALRVVRVLVAPYLGHAGSTAVGRQALLDLVLAQFGPAVSKLLAASLRPEALRVAAALLELVGTMTTGRADTSKKTKGKKEGGGFVLASGTVDRVLAKIAAAGEDKGGTMELLAAYLQWGRAEEEQEEGILAEMVRLEVSSARTNHAACVATAVAHASGGLEMQLRVLRCLEQRVDEAIQKDEDETAAAGVVLARACRLFTCMAEDAGTGDGPAAEAIRQTARPFLGQVVHLLAKLVGQAVSSPSSSASKFEGLLQGVSVLQLYARKRWLFSTSGGMRVEDLGRLFAPLAGLPAALMGQPSPEQQADAEEIFAAICRLISALLKHQPRLVYQCAPPFFLVTRALFRALVANATTAAHPWGPAPAKAWTRLAEHLAGHAAALRRHLMLLVTDYLTVCPHLGAELKTRLQPAAFALMDTLTPFEIQHMHAALLDAAGQALLKKLHNDYQQRHKYRGKV